MEWLVELAAVPSLTAIPSCFSACSFVGNTRVCLNPINSCRHRLACLLGPNNHEVQQYQSKVGVDGKDAHMDLASLIWDLSKRQLPHVADDIFLKMKSEGYVPNNSTLSALLLCYADNGLLTHAEVIWDEMLNRAFSPDLHIISALIDAYGKRGRFNEVVRVVHQLSSTGLKLLPDVYKLAISCFGRRGQLDKMESMVREMVSSGFLVNSEIGNAFIVYYSNFGSLTDMEAAYGRVRRSRILIQEEGIRAMSLAYMKEKKFYKLGEFLREVGLGRKNLGNLLWNILLLSYAVNFKMKSLQREFLKMLDAGFNPDLTTFNIRALAFSKMSLFWDLHLTLEHMKCKRVAPDLVTYGCVVDAYLDKRLIRNLDFALSKMEVDDHPSVLTDPLVFEVMGKGDFHLSSEAFLEFSSGKPWTYGKLISTYLKKQSRQSQIFWNY